MPSTMNNIHFKYRHDYPIGPTFGDNKYFNFYDMSDILWYSGVLPINLTIFALQILINI